MQQHEQLAICYAMKEQLSCLFESRCFEKSLEDWQEWFDAAKASNIPALVRFATLKEKRIWELASHALFPIHTGKLEGFNNKIKVAKRIAYGYRNLDYFFNLIRYISLPSVRLPPRNP